jgi:hypothetical protein
VYVSIFESWSNDKTPDLLEAWKNDLSARGIANTFILRDKEIKKPNPYFTNQHRIIFLSESRNRALEPLHKLNQTFDRILFSNDVYIHAESAVELLRTRNGSYDVACGMDFAQWGLYDTWVTRDRYGNFIATLYPYLIEKSGYEAIGADHPAPVFACWNGIFAARAEPFYPPARRPNNTSHLENRPLSQKLAWTHPAANEYPRTPPRQMPALKFRASAKDECFSSVSPHAPSFPDPQLPYDLRRQYGLDKHYMNPLVISAYHHDHYYVVKRIYRHWLVQWFVKNVENGYLVHKAVMTNGDPNHVFSWDGGLCHGVSLPPSSFPSLFH